MSKPKTRDNTYWLGRLEREHPAIFDRLRSGAIPSVRAACAEARLIHLPSPLDALKRERARTSSAERAAFVAWAKGMLPPRPTVVSFPIVLTDPDGTPLPEVIDRSKVIIARPGGGRSGWEGCCHRPPPAAMTVWAGSPVPSVRGPPA